MAGESAREDIEPLRTEVNKLGEQLDAAKSELEALLAEIRDIALAIPNIPHDDVPVGRDENDNVEVSRWGTPRQFDFDVRDHVTLGEMHGGWILPLPLSSPVRASW